MLSLGLHHGFRGWKDCWVLACVSAGPRGPRDWSWASGLGEGGGTRRCPRAYTPSRRRLRGRGAGEPGALPEPGSSFPGQLGVGAGCRGPNRVAGGQGSLSLEIYLGVMRIFLL